MMKGIKTFFLVASEVDNRAQNSFLCQALFGGYLKVSLIRSSDVFKVVFLDVCLFSNRKI